VPKKKEEKKTPLLPYPHPDLQHAQAPPEITSMASPKRTHLDIGDRYEDHGIK
jgi:hypothetical protein